MTKEEHLEILTRGVEVWNSWRDDYPRIHPDLSNAQLSSYQKKMDLRGVNFSNTNLKEACLKSANLSNANLRSSMLDSVVLVDANLTNADLYFAKLRNARLSGANFTQASLVSADMRGAHLASSNFTKARLTMAWLDGAILHNAKLIGAVMCFTMSTGADFSNADFTGADIHNSILKDVRLTGATLSNAYLVATNLSGAVLQNAKLDNANLENADLTYANLSGADLTGTRIGTATIKSTVFGNNDLSQVKGLDQVYYRGPASVGVDTIYRSKGNLPEVFLRGTGIPDNFITYISSLTAEALEFYSCFISYSHADASFARRLHDALQGRGIRCWLDEHALLPGDKIYTEVDRGIRLWDKILLCCSKNSLRSWWVDNEIKIAFDKEQHLWRKRGKEVLALIPLNLDDYLFTDQWQSGLATEVKARMAANFTGWERDNKKFEDQFERLVKALRTDSGIKRPPPPMLL